jgi:PAS domain S-box-containing protein
LRKGQQFAQQAEKEQRLHFEMLLTDVCAQFVDVVPSEIDSAIENAQRVICESLGVNHSSVWQTSQDNPEQLVMTHSYRDPSLKPLPSRPILKEYFPWSQSKILNKKIVCVPSTSNLPPEAAKDMESWRQYGIRSTLAFPLAVGGGPVIGFIAFDSTDGRDWPELLQRRLQVLAHVIAQALDRREVERKLRESESRFRLVADTAPVMIWMSGTDKLCTYFNKPWLNFTGRSIESELGNGWADGVHSEDLRRCMDTYSNAFDHCEEFRMEYRLRRHDGEYRWILDIGVPRFNQDRSFAGYIGSCIDVTEHIRAEEALRKSEERLRMAQWAAHIGTFDVNMRTGVDTWTPETEALYGLPPGGFGGTLTAFENLIHPDDRQTVIELTREMLRTGKPTEGEWRVVWPDGSVHWIAGRGQVLMDESGEPSRMIGVNMDVTEHKLAERELANANERLRLAIESGSVGGWDYDLKTGRNVWFGNAHAQLGMTPDESPGSPKEFWDRVHEGDRERVERALQVAKEKRQDFAEDVRVVWRNGTTRWLRSRGRFQYAATGEAQRSLGISLDITERKMAEERLREYEEAVEGAEDIIGVVDREYRLILANRQYLKMRNMTREQVVGRFVPDVLGKEVFETVIKPKLDECFRGNVVRYEMRFSYPTVGERDLLLSYFPIKAANGTIDRVVSILHDITDRKRAEEVLLEMNRTLEVQGSLLRSREELLSVFVKNVPAGVAMLDRDMRYLQVSDRWCGDYLLGRADILGRSHYEIFPDMPERWKEVHRRALQGETLRADEDRWDGQDGARWTRWEVRPWKTVEGEVGGILIFAEDITHRKQMEESLSDMTRKLVEAHEQERARIARELHDDITQRLAMLAIEIDHMQELRPEIPSEMRDRAHELSKRAKEISSDIQSLSRELHSSALEYLGLEAGMRSWCKEFGERHKLEITFHSHDLQQPPREISLCLFRILQEALQNAAKHSGAKRIGVQLAGNSGGIHLVVSDAGAGFDVKAPGRSRGLGLTSMQERVRLVNGEISIESKPLAGTTIHVSVPLEAERDYKANRTS